MLARKIEKINRIPCRVAGSWDGLRLTHFEVVCRYHQRALELQRQDKPRRRMPLNMPVVKPNTRVVCSEAEDIVAARIHHERVTAHGKLLELIFGHIGRIVRTRILRAARNLLEIVTMQVEGVLIRVEVVEHDLDDVKVVENEGISVSAVDLG
jgi:hypothetical protein